MKRNFCRNKIASDEYLIKFNIHQASIFLFFILRNKIPHAEQVVFSHGSTWLCYVAPMIHIGRLMNMMWLIMAVMWFSRTSRLKWRHVQSIWPLHVNSNISYFSWQENRNEYIFHRSWKMKHVIQNQVLPCIMVMFTRKVFKHAGNINRATVLFSFVKYLRALHYDCKQFQVRKFVKTEQVKNRN